MKLWTIQHAEKLEEIESLGKLVCLGNHYSKEWNIAYKWMARQMKERIGTPINKNQYPIWAWYQYMDSGNKKPDLRRSSHLPKGTKGIRIEFEKPTASFLLSDFELWHYCLDYKSYIGKNEYDSKEHDSFLRGNKLENVKYEELPKNLRKKIERSWGLIFDMSFEDEYGSRQVSEKMIQAALWSIDRSEIIAIDRFIAR